MKDIRKYYETLETDGEKAEFLQSMVQECNGWDGSLDDYRYEENDEYFFNTYFEGRPLEAVRAVNYGSYNYVDEYVCFNAYGNLDSVNEFEREARLLDGADEIIERAIELQDENSIDIDYLIDDEFEIEDDEE